jgi:hypothetical protein
MIWKGLSKTPSNRKKSLEGHCVGLFVRYPISAKNKTSNVVQKTSKLRNNLYYPSHGSSMQKWEYTVWFFGNTNQVTISELNILGSAGWEMTGIFKHAIYFKRPIESDLEKFTKFMNPE